MLEDHGFNPIMLEEREFKLAPDYSSLADTSVDLLNEFLSLDKVSKERSVDHKIAISQIESLRDTISVLEDEIKKPENEIKNSHCLLKSMNMKAHAWV